MAGGRPLIVAKSGKIEVYSVSIVSGIAVFLPSDDALPLEGDYGAAVLCRNFARDVALADMRTETAAKCLHTIAGRIAETVDSVGERGKYGMDMVVFTSAGAVAKLARRTGKMGTLSVRFSEHGAEPLFGRNGGI